MQKKLYLAGVAVLLASLVAIGIGQKSRLEAHSVASKGKAGVLQKAFHTSAKAASQSVTSNDLENRVAKLEAAAQRLNNEIYWLRTKVDRLERLEQTVQFMKYEVDNLKFYAHRH